MAFPEQLRSSLYTNNLAESLKRMTKVKEQFPKENAPEGCVCIHFISDTAKSEQRKH